jgi:hypothetical protein
MFDPPIVVSLALVGAEWCFELGSSGSRVLSGLRSWLEWMCPCGVIVCVIPLF